MRWGGRWRGGGVGAINDGWMDGWVCWVGGVRERERVSE